MSLHQCHQDSFSAHSLHLIPRPISYALCILAFYTCLALWFLTVSCQSDLRWTRLTQSIPDNSLLYFGTVHLHATVSNELRDNRHKCAGMKLPHYSPLLMSFQPNTPPPSALFLHPSSVSPLRCCLWHVESKEFMVCSYTLTHTNNQRVHGRTMMPLTLSVLSTHLHLSSGAVSLCHLLP